MTESSEIQHQLLSAIVKGEMQAIASEIIKDVGESELALTGRIDQVRLDIQKEVSRLEIAVSERIGKVELTMGERFVKVETERCQDREKINIVEAIVGSHSPIIAEVDKLRSVVTWLVRGIISLAFAVITAMVIFFATGGNISSSVKAGQIQQQLQK